MSGVLPVETLADRGPLDGARVASPGHGTHPRVLFVSHTGTMSGAELVLRDAVRPWAGSTALLFEDGAFAGALRDLGLKVRLARSGAALTGLRRDASPLRALPMLGRLGGLALEVARAARACDVVYANSQKAFLLASLPARLVGRPLIWHLHDILDGAHFGRAQRLVQARLANLCAARVVVPSQAAADAFLRAGGRPSLVTVVPNGLDLDRDPRPAAALRAELGLPAGPLIGVFSRLAPWKGQDVVLEALAELPGVRCIVVGAPLFGEDAYAAHLRDRAAARGLSDRVLFLGQRGDVPALMQAVDAVVHPSVDPEPFGRTLVEAMLAGVPVIATDAGASAEILDGGAVGTLVPPRRPDRLAAALAELFDAPDAFVARTRRARERAIARYGAAEMQRALADLILRVAARA
ncbi:MULTISPECIES: glycosyltransferase [Methylobacterium]|uniref:Glycosyltransferase n=1 Tax=Methylobacterium longum TaxID=767694 RepID=A0ABT8AWH8_9HYPH|nr:MULTISPECIES: glycosyltransferase [Methylobacterium]MCJ2098284.1 glycosyltransferase [Methylobacterium sp. E-046]MDN3574188.1 glycosyltransferase [Methylobacterium longum]GJE11493.1 D-inositol-3-phosphate glycosyltransferase [Methylobacterium longum]